MSNNILIIEDDHAVNVLLSKNLTKLGYQIDTAFDGEQGLKKALHEDFQLILLDVMIPKIDGFNVLKSLREKKLTPVIMLTAKGGEEDRICGFKTGADDYLLKPFSMAELELRIQAILRRTQMLQTFEALKYQENLNTAENSSKSIQFNKRIGQIVIRNQQVAFTPIEFDLLFALVAEQSEILSKAHLYQNVLLREFSRYDRTLDMHISKIRKKITSAGMDVNTIKTVRGQGYCFEE
mgnify:FL=1